MPRVFMAGSKQQSNRGLGTNRVHFWWADFMQGFLLCTCADDLQSSCYPTTNGQFGGGFFLGIRYLVSFITQKQYYSSDEQFARQAIHSEIM